MFSLALRWRWLISSHSHQSIPRPPGDYPGGLVFGLKIRCSESNELACQTLPPLAVVLLLSLSLHWCQLCDVAAAGVVIRIVTPVVTLLVISMARVKQLSNLFVSGLSLRCGLPPALDRGRPNLLVVNAL